MLLWQEKDPVPERYRLWPHEKGIVLMMKPDLAEEADLRLWQTAGVRIEQWQKTYQPAKPGDPMISAEWEGTNPIQGWGFGGVGTLGGLERADDPRREWIPYLFAFYPAEDRSGRQRALDIAATLTHALDFLNSNGLKDPEDDPGAQLMLIQTITDPRGYNLSMDVSASFRRWIEIVDPIRLDGVERAASKAHELLSLRFLAQYLLSNGSDTGIASFLRLRFSSEHFALNIDHIGAKDQGLTLESVEVDTPVRQLILLRALAAFWAIYYRRA
jgi:hypothetical protein